MTLLILSLSLFALMVLIVRHHLRLGHEIEQGNRPYKNEMLLEGGFGGGGYGGGHSHVWRVTRDPEAYAKGFVPAKVRKKT